MIDRVATFEVRIAADGTVMSMHSDELMPVIAAAGAARIERASHVEPDGLRWGVWSAAGVDTGKRFDTRAQALAWEHENFWSLIEKGTP